MSFFQCGVSLHTCMRFRQNAIPCGVNVNVNNVCEETCHAYSDGQREMAQGCDGAFASVELCCTVQGALLLA